MPYVRTIFCFQYRRSRTVGNQNQLDLLITESAGLCNRCSPYLAEIKGVCIIDNLSGINTPKKIGPMLKSADFVVITKGILYHKRKEKYLPHVLLQ